MHGTIIPIEYRHSVRFTTKLWKRRLPRALAALAAVSLVGVAGASTPRQLLQQARPGGAPSAGDLFHAQALKTGAQACAGTYAALGESLTEGATFAVQTQTAPASPNAHIVEGAVGMTYALPELRGQAAGVLVAAPTATGCEGQFVRVAPFQQSCGAVIRLLPPGSEHERDLSGVGLYRLGGNRGEAMFISSGSGCVVVSIINGAQR